MFLDIANEYIIYIYIYISAAISLRLQGKLSFPYNCQKMNGQIYTIMLTFYWLKMR